MADIYRIKNPEYRELEKVRDKERKLIKYRNEEEYRNMVKDRNNKRYIKNKPLTRCCKDCNKEIENIPYRVRCTDCYKVYTRFTV